MLSGTSLLVQRLRIHLAMQGTWVWLSWARTSLSEAEEESSSSSSSWEGAGCRGWGRQERKGDTQGRACLLCSLFLEGIWAGGFPYFQAVPSEGQRCSEGEAQHGSWDEVSQVRVSSILESDSRWTFENIWELTVLRCFICVLLPNILRYLEFS